MRSPNRRKHLSSTNLRPDISMGSSISNCGKSVANISLSNGTREAISRVWCKQATPVLGVRTRRVKASLLGKFWFNRGPIIYNSIWKHTLLKLGDFSKFRSSHRTNLYQSARHLLPIQHFRFAGSLYQKIRMGLREIATIAVPSIIASCRN